MKRIKIKKISWGKMVITFILTLMYEAVHLTPAKRFIQARTAKVNVNKKWIGSIPVIEYYTDNSINKKLVIVQHGYGSDKTSMKNLAVKLANEGYFAVAPDAYGHGARMEAGKLSIPLIIKQTCSDYDKLIRHYRKNTDVNAEIFSIAGVSMGGMIAYEYIVYGKYKPRVIAPAITTPDFKDLVNYRLGLTYYENHKVKYVSDENEIQEYNRKLEMADIYDKVKNIKDVAVIVQNMRFDFLISTAGSDRLYKDWKDNREKGSYEYHKIMAFFHYLPDKAVKNIINFLNLHNKS